ncbi:heme-dependent oxidative N-demethylase family protein [Actibacterium pelagium]|uniref:DUF3445 domain-containing protein n=1 Tax=Actibacterium pelagium TaxID=2029103 RepID=A0A917AHV1_9RHOB|nr:DUF3445 domain-containing protein [Actibacterium pelagium]GGE54264.1 hypothetical protein GCM10011517_22320 [Actibacterium pelagium]
MPQSEDISALAPRPDRSALINQPLATAPWEKPRFSSIPGTEAIGPDDWLHISDTYAGQMQERLHLIQANRDAVIGQTEEAGPAIAELLERVLDILRTNPQYRFQGDFVTCPDGREVQLGDPLTTLAQLVQEDLCLLESRGDEYQLVAAVLCFPSGWTLAEKLGRSMIRIHAPVSVYDEMAAKRVGRLMNGVQPDRPIMRWNGNFKSDAELFTPETEADHHRPRQKETPEYFRSERQCLVRLPETRAILFSIHTYQWRLDDLPVSPPQTLD